MQRDLQIIGDRIEFMGYHVGTLNCKGAPPNTYEDFIRTIKGQRPLSVSEKNRGPNVAYNQD